MISNITVLAFGSADFLKVIDLMYAKQIAENTYGSAIGVELMSASRGIAGIAGLFYIASKLSGQIIRNEGINFIPLLRPFALMILIGLIPDITTLIDTTFKKVAVAARADSESVKVRVDELQKKREQAVKRKWKEIEDNEDALEMLSSYLEALDFQVTGATNGQTGIQLIKSKIPDVAIIDIGLPDMDGYEIARVLRSDPVTNKIKLITATGYGGNADKAQALEAGFDVHLTKPINMQQLMAHLNS